MYRWIYLFLMIAIVTAVLGFSSIEAGAAASIGKILFCIFSVLFLITLMFGSSVSRKDI
jgi:uncharacterized membrane protein YtjA (UPF0391 family)